MNLHSISLRNLRTRAVSSVLTTLAIALGTALLAGLWLLLAETERKYQANVEGYGVVVGPKEGSPLDLVLATVFNLQELAPQAGLVPFGVYLELHSGRLRTFDRNGRARWRRFPIRYAIPQCRGDSYKGFPVIGTTDEMFSKFARGSRRGPDGERIPVLLEFAEGEAFAFSHEDFVAFAEERARAHGSHDGHGDDHDHDHAHDAGIPERWRKAVIGQRVADRLGLGVGDTIVPVHGVADDLTAHVHAEAACSVVGVLARTDTPLDRSVFVPAGMFLSMDKHDAIRASQGAEAENVGLSAVVVQTVRPYQFGPKLRYELQTRPDAQAAVPGLEIQRLLRVVGDASKLLRAVSYLVLVVAGISIFVSLYNTMNERRREIAIMRSLGARRVQILWIIVEEAALIALTGAVLGVVMCHVAAFFLAETVADYTSVPIDWAAFSLEEAWLILGVVVLGAVSGLIPAAKGSRTQVADNLGPTT